MQNARDRDHRKLGPVQDLFFFDPSSPGCCFFKPKGVDIINRLENALRKQYKIRGYQEVRTPVIVNTDIWAQSGHAEHYMDNMFTLKVGDQDYGLKPMNCPLHCIMFRQKPRALKDLPLRHAEFGVLHRNEASGALGGLTRCRKFEQDDAHIFCSESQVEEEVKSCLGFIDYLYGILGFQYDLKLSTKPAKFTGEDVIWEKAEKQLINALDNFGRPWEL